MSGNGTTMVVDSDAHVVETEATWEYLDASEKKYRPPALRFPRGLDHPVLGAGREGVWDSVSRA